MNRASIDIARETVNRNCDNPGSPQAQVRPEAVEAALYEDLNTPIALAALAQIAGEARKAESTEARAARKAELLGAGVLLGLFQQDPAAWFAQTPVGVADIDETEVQRPLDARAAAKKARDFTQAYAIHAQLTHMGVVIEDTPQGACWKRAAG